MFSNRSMKAKMLATSVILVGFLVSVGMVGIFYLDSVSTKYTHVAKINLPNAQLLSQMEKGSQDIARQFLRLALPSTMTAERTKRLQQIDSFFEAYAVADKKYQAVDFVPGEAEIYEKVAVAWTRFAETAKKITPLLDSGNPEDLATFQTEVEGNLMLRRTEFGSAVEKLIAFQSEQAAGSVQSAESTSTLAKTMTAGCVAIGSIIALVLAFLSAGSLAKALKTISTEIAESGSQVQTASEQLSSASQALSSGATQAASALEETVASVEELSSMVKLNADNAKEASALSQSSKQAAEDGEVEIQKLNEAVNEIAQSSKKIEEIINVIDDIAFQTNLLALNAAVEAARAGEQGKGFAVVADAVRALAQRSASAAKDITTLIEESVAKIDRGAKIADEGGKVLRSIVVSVKKVADLNNEIATASQEQSNGLAQISKAMNELDQATQRNAASAEETAASSEEMSSQAVNLGQFVDGLNVVIEGKQGQNTSTKALASAPRPSNKANVSRRELAVVTPLPNRNGHIAKATIPFDEEAPQRKVGNLDGF